MDAIEDAERRIFDLQPLEELRHVVHAMEINPHGHVTIKLAGGVTLRKTSPTTFGEFRRATAGCLFRCVSLRLLQWLKV